MRHGTRDHNLRRASADLLSGAVATDARPPMAPLFVVEEVAARAWFVSSFANVTAFATDAGYLLAHLSELLVIDARSPERYRGENETLDPVAGHIPGAVNRFYRLNLTGDGHFKPPRELKREFAPIIGPRTSARVVHQCGSGVTACHNLLAMEVAGMSGSILYPGSWSEWCSDPARPIAAGA